MMKTKSHEAPYYSPKPHQPSASGPRSRKATPAGCLNRHEIMMKKMNDIPEGYKQTKVGVIPKSWKTTTLGKAVTFLDGKRKPLKEADRAKMHGIYPYYGASGIIDYVNGYIFDEHLILLGEDGANIVNRSSPLAFRVKGKIWVNNHAHVLRPNSSFEIGYLVEFLESVKYDKYNTGTAQPKLNKDICTKIPIPLPPLPEQQKIAEILSTWDTAISTTQKLIAQLQLRNKGLAQQLLTGKKRLRGFEGEWEEYKVSDLFQMVNRHIDWDDNAFYNLVSIRRRHGGVFFRGSFQGKEIKVKKLKRIQAGDFLISKRQVSHGAWAVITNSFDSFLVSDEYDCLVIKNKEKLTSNFWTFYCQQPKMTHYAFLDSIGVHIEKLIFHFRQFKKRPLKVPDFHEQLAIASVLEEAAKELKLNQQKLDTLKQQKKGLMQKLLTGEVRVKI